MMSTYKCLRLVILVVIITAATLAKQNESSNQNISFATSEKPSGYQTTGIPAIAALLPLITSGGVPSFGQMVTGSLTLAKPLIEAELTGRKVGVKCRADFNEILDGIASGELWALQILDSYGKPEAGILQGSKLWLGNFDQCLDFYTTALNAHLDHDNPTSFTTKYCRVTLPVGQLLPDTFQAIAESVTVGSCVSQSCSPSDISGIIVGIQSLLNLTEKPLVPSEVFCVEDKTLSPGAIAFICVLSIVGFLILIGTIYDVIAIQMKSGDNVKVNQDKKLPVQKHGVLNDHVTSEANGVTLQTFIHATDICEKPGLPNVLGEPTANGKQAFVNNGYEDPNVSSLKPDVYISGLTEDTQQTKHTETKKCASTPKTRRETGFVSRVLLSFSAYSNAVKILSTNQGTGSLGAVNGIRFLSMAWVILGHTLVFPLEFSSNGMSYGIRSTMDKWSFIAMANATFSVDSFFTLSGLLVAYLSLREIEKVGGARSFNWGMFYFHRYWRLTPVYMFVMVFGILLYPLLLIGPMSPDIPVMSDCSRYWWTNLLYVNNLVTDKSATSMCMAWSWYLANDMQFYVVSPLLMLPLFYNLYAGIASCLVFLAVTTGLAAFIVMEHEYPAQILSPFLPAAKDEYGFFNLYVPCYTRMGPYIIGIFTGYLLYKWKCVCRIKTTVNLILWTVALCSCAAIVYSQYNHWDSNIFTLQGSAAYTALSRTAWGCVICWIVFACATGNGGWIDEVLSWKPFIPLGRLSYCAYLIHPLLMYGYHELDRTSFYFTNLTLSYLFAANMVFSYGGAFLTSLAFEAPMMGLEKAIFKRK